MWSIRIWLCFAMIFAANPCFACQDSVTIEGKIIGVRGSEPAYQVAPFWRANGNGRNKDGSPLDLTVDENAKRIWGNVGSMSPALAENECTAQPDGRFRQDVGWRTRALLVMDENRQQGAIVEIPQKNSEAELTVQTKPLTIVRARLSSDDPVKTLAWGHVYVKLPVRSDRPLANNRIVSCGTFDGRIEFRLPPGKYEIEAYGTSEKAGDEIDLKAESRISFEISDSQDLDLGTISLVSGLPDVNQLRQDSKVAGRWRDYREHFGELAPAWHSSEARGFSKSPTLKSLRGKWVLINFWGLSCAPCLKKSIPKLIRFYDENQKFRQRFEIVGICVAYDGEVESLEQLDQKLKSIVLHVWGGKQIPFPVVLDRTFKSWERYGIPGLGTTVLVDPAGQLVAGDIDKLRRILNEQSQ